MATAELAVAMPAVVLLLAVALSACAAAVDHIRCTDAARVAVRLLARGEPQQRALEAARATGPDGAAVVVTTGPTEVTVEVSAQPPRLLGWLGVTARPAATAVAAREDAWLQGGAWRP
jgi:hypothetical protein